MVVSQLCSPAFIYLCFSLTQITIDSVKGEYNKAFFKFWIMIIVTLLLNNLCMRGLGIASWIIVFVPFMLMSTVTAILLYVFGFDPTTGKLKNYKPENKHQKHLDVREQAAQMNVNNMFSHSSKKSSTKLVGNDIHSTSSNVEHLNKKIKEGGPGPAFSQEITPSLLDDSARLSKKVLASVDDDFNAANIEKEPKSHDLDSQTKKQTTTLKPMSVAPTPAAPKPAAPKPAAPTPAAPTPAAPKLAAPKPAEPKPAEPKSATSPNCTIPQTTWINNKMGGDTNWTLAKGEAVQKCKVPDNLMSRITNKVLNAVKPAAPKPAAPKPAAPKPAAPTYEMVDIRTNPDLRKLYGPENEDGSGKGGFDYRNVGSNGVYYKSQKLSYKEVEKCKQSCLDDPECDIMHHFYSDATCFLGKKENVADKSKWMCHWYQNGCKGKNYAFFAKQEKVKTFECPSEFPHLKPWENKPGNSVWCYKSESGTGPACNIPKNSVLSKGLVKGFNKNLTTCSS